ncbi:hypothetical protein SK128_017169, partial [Halocaridina rubra]
VKSWKVKMNRWIYYVNLLAIAATTVKCNPLRQPQSSSSSHTEEKNLGPKSELLPTNPDEIVNKPYGEQPLPRRHGFHKGLTAEPSISAIERTARSDSPSARRERLLNAPNFAAHVYEGPTNTTKNPPNTAIGNKTEIKVLLEISKNKTYHISNSKNQSNSKSNHALHPVDENSTISKYTDTQDPKLYNSTSHNGNIHDLDSLNLSKHKNQSTQTRYSSA